MLKIFDKNKKIICYILAFTLPLAYMLIICASLKFYPFGNISPLVADTDVQFVSYIAYLKSIFYGNNDFLYTFSKTIGGDMAGFSFYYLGNPFVYLLLLCPNELLPMGIMFMIILISCFSGLTFNIMLNNIFEFKWGSLIFSSAYALMGYFTAYFNCILYFNNVMLLPIIVLGLYELVVKGKKNYKYIIFLALTIITNYYMGYMTCIFTVIMFAYLYINKVKNFEEFKANLNILWIYVYSSIIAVLISCVSLVTVIISLQGQKITDDSGFSISLSRNFSILDVFSESYCLGFNGNISDGLPTIYSSTIVMVFVLLYFINNKISIKEKILSGSVILIMVVSFCSDTFNVLWHGFAHPVGFPYRNAFFLSFALIIVAYKGLLLMSKGTRKYHIVLVLLVFTLYSFYMLMSHSNYVNFLQIILTGSFYIMILSGVYILCYKKQYMGPIIFGFLVIFSFDVLLNGYHSIFKYFPDMDKEPERYTMESYQKYYNELDEIIKSINARDDGFYRVDKLFRRNHNDAMYSAYNGLSHFSSCETNDVKDFMNSLGFCTSNMWSYYGVEGNTAFSDCLLGLKYLISQYDETSRPYNKVITYNDKSVFQNPYVLPLCFDGTKEVYSTQRDDFNHFTLQNEIAKDLTGQVYGIYRPVEITEIDYFNVIRNGKNYQRVDKNQEAYIRFNLNVDSDDFIFMYLYGKNGQKVRITVNDMEKYDYFNVYSHSVREVGYFEPGQEVCITLSFTSDEIELGGYEFYYENPSELKRWYEDEIETTCNVEKITSSHLKIDADVSKDHECLIMSMPYDKGWTITVDGNKVEPKKVYGALMAIDMEAGSHEIEMKYMPRGLILGGVISIVGIVFLLILYIDDIRRIKKILKG